MTVLILNIIASAAVLAHAVCAINHMDRHTWHVQRVAYIVLALGAAAVLFGPFYGYLVPPPAETLTNLGAAGVLLSRVWLDWQEKKRSKGDDRDH